VSATGDSGRDALALFDALVDLDQPAREAELARGGHDPEAVATVRRWLAADRPDARLAPERYAPARAAAGAGDRIGAWTLVREIGRGGMGSVWLAERVDGDFAQRAALKLIRPDLAAHDADQRFRRERRILATLKHPNIAQLLDGGVTGEGRPWLAMEWVEGETLRERLARAPFEPQRLVVLAGEIASALAHAHAAGVVHRDLKPDNVMLAPEGYAKVLDFGVAKLVAEDGSRGTQTETQPGRILGTTPYMSPEQASGGTIDFRSDQFALGALLYEAATGKAAFARDTPAETVAAVLRDTPPMGAAIPPALPPGFRRIVARCLSKDPADRYASTHDLARDLADLARGSGEPLAQPRGRRWSRALLAGVAAVVLAAATGAWLGRRQVAADAPRPLRAELSIAPAERLWPGYFPMHAFALAPTGDRIAYVGETDGRRMLHLRTLATRESVVLPGTENPSHPMFSPDGEWIAYFANGFELRKVPARGGSSTVLAEAPNHLGGGAWAADAIYYSPHPGTGIWRVSPDGGTPEPVTFPDPATEGSHVWPTPVPGTGEILYVAELEPHDTFDAGRIYRFDPATKTRTLLVDGGTDPRVVGDTLYYAREGTIYAVGYDAAARALRGSPRPIHERVAYSAVTGAAQFDVAAGVSVRLAGGTAGDLIEPVVVDRAGVAEPLGLEPRIYANVRVSPDGRRALLGITSADDDLWIYDFERRVLTRLTEREENIHPAWGHDGRTAYYSHHRAGTLPTIWRRDTGGASDPEQLTRDGDALAQLVRDVSRDGRYVLFDQFLSSTDFDIGLYDTRERTVRAWLRTPDRERVAAISPDGRYVAFLSDLSGAYEVYLQTFDGPARRWQISQGGGNHPRWRADGRELYFFEKDTLFAVSIAPGDDPAPGEPVALLRGDYAPTYDVFPDGRFLMRRYVRDAALAGPLLIDVER
jgi:serine/threonine-protein kinase